MNEMIDLLKGNMFKDANLRILELPILKGTENEEMNVIHI